MELTINKKRMLQAIDELPDDATVEQAIYRLYVLDQVSKALADSGERIPHEEMKDRWGKKNKNKGKKTSE